MTIASVILADTPTLYWKLDDPTGPAASDSSGNGNPGFYLGTVNLGQPGPESGTFAALLGAAGGVRTPGGSPRRALPFSFDIWVAPQSQETSGNVIVYNGISSADGVGECWDIPQGVGVLAKLLRGGIGFGGAVGPLQVGVWHHIAQTWSAASNLNIYFDGVNVGAAAALAFNAIGAASPFVVGAAAFAGQLMYAAHAALYPSELSAARIAAHFAAPAAVTTPPVVGQATSTDTATFLSDLAALLGFVARDLRNTP
jgi:hypothetical protein